MLGLVADDLTGALDAGAGFVRHGLRAILPFSGRPEDAPGADVVLINTNTREGTASEAGRITRDAAALLKAAGVTRVYKKIDSVLRGHPGEELAAVLDVYGGRAAVAPAFPAQGRITRCGVQYAHGQPVGPYGGFLRDALSRAAVRADVFDAESDDDLARVAAQVASNPTYRIWCGAAGLAARLPAALQLKGASDVPKLPEAKRAYVLAGTGHPVTNAQLDMLDVASPPGVQVLVEGRRFQKLGDVIEALEREARALPLGNATALIVTGGETAMIVCRALRAVSIEVLGEALPGIPLGLLRLPGCTLPVATKSGGFGDPSALVVTARRLLCGA